jgi:hypothetical protein
MIIKDYEVLSLDMCKGGTSLQGYKPTTYARLHEVLGPPTITESDPNEKVQCEWILSIQWYDANTIDEIDYDDWNTSEVTIYNWKTGFVPTDEYSWHIGGNSIFDTDLIDLIVDNYNQNGINYNGERKYVA